MTVEKENTSYIKTEDGKVVKISDYKKAAASRKRVVVESGGGGEANRIGTKRTETKRTDRS